MINTPQAPYYDDFDVEKNFLKILFKPKLSVQTRELEQIQSMFQNQIETLASQIFQNGSVVSGGKFTFKDKVNYVKLYNELNGQIFNYNIYNERHVYGTTTKILARVFNGWSQSDNEEATVYLDYLNSGEITEDNITKQVSTFQPGEVIQLVSKIYMSQVSGTVEIGNTLRGLGESGAKATVVNIDNNEYEVVYTTNNTFLTGEQIFVEETGGYYLYTAGESVIYKAQIKSTADSSNPIGSGSAVFVDEGIYYIDGYFVHTDNQSKIISSYTTNTNARVGFEKEVEIITSEMDPSLLDNANGYPNYNAPGADRLKINLRLNYYNLFETPSENFVEVITIENSTITGNSSINQKYSEILDTMARRTYDESGNYTVKPFLIDIREFLDDGTNNGIYKPEYYAFSTRDEALNASMRVFDIPEPGAAHIYGTRYYPCIDHDTYLEECKNRLVVGVEPGKAYVMGYEINHESKQWFPVLKARDVKTLNNSANTVFYGNYIKVTNLVGLPNIYNHQLVNLSSDSTYDFNNPTIIGTARIYGFEVESGIPGSLDAVYKIYLENINMTSGSFNTSVNSLGVQELIDPSDASLGYNVMFSAVAVKTNGSINVYNMENSALIFTLEKDNISSVSDASYDYKKVFTGLVSSPGSGSYGTITIASGDNSRFKINDTKDYTITILSGSLAGTVIDNDSITVSQETSGNVTFSNLPSDTINNRYMIIANLHKTVDNIKTKVLHSDVEYIYIPDGSTISEIVLNHSDGYRLVGIYESADAATTPTTSDTNITSSFTFDNGQRDTYYDLARVKLKEGAIQPTGQVLIVYDYFSHSAGDYFTVDSYPNIDYKDIPTYVGTSGTYNLKNCIDFRGRIDDNGSTFTSSTLPYIFQNNTIFEADVDYYLPRMDVFELNYRGDFNIKYGTSSEDPQYPVGSINSMTLYYLGMPAYTESPDDVSRIYCENKRYTMRDIGNLDNRITAIENYIMLNNNEMDTNNLQIFDVNGYECIKTGFIVDIFINHDYGDTTVAGYRCSVDPDTGTLRPDYKLHVIELVKSSIRTSSIREEGGLYLIPYTSKKYITNSVNTSYLPLNSNKVVQWEGNVVLNRTLSTVYNNIDITSINYGKSTVLTPNAKTYNIIERSWIGQNNLFN